MVSYTLLLIRITLLLSRRYIAIYSGYASFMYAQENVDTYVNYIG